MGGKNVGLAFITRLNHKVILDIARNYQIIINPG